MILTFWRACRAWCLAALTLGLGLQAAQAATDYSAGVDTSGGTALLWFASNVGSTWVDAHYRVDGGAQQNVRMTYNATTARFETPVAARSGQTVQASFTYTKGGLAYDSGTETLPVGGSGGGGTASAPVFSPAPGRYTAAQSVTLSSATPGAVIRYTTNGSDPTGTSPLYSGPITVSASTTLKAIATASGLTDSAVASGAYVIDTGSSPFSQGATTSNGVVTLWFQGPAGTAWVDVHYNAGAGPQNLRMAYNAALARHEVSFAAPAGSTVNYAFTYFTNVAQDTVAFSYLVGGGGGGGGGGGDDKVATPVITPAGGSYTAAQNVTLSSATADAIVRYTLDGSLPTSSSAAYTGTPLRVDRSLTLKAAAFKAGMTTSDVATATYTLQPPADGFTQGVAEIGTTATVWFKPAVGASFVVLHYQLGTGPQINPTMAYNSQLQRYEFVISPVSKGSMLTYSFTWTPTGGTQRDTAEVSYRLGDGSNDVARPVFSPSSGTYASAVTVTMACQDATQALYYTRDNTLPTVRATRYTGPVSVTTAASFNALCVTADGRESGVASAGYAVAVPGGDVAAPTFSHAGGTYPNRRIALTMMTATVGATVRYTTDGSTPSEASTPYIGPVYLSVGTRTVKAMAFKAGRAASPVASATYVLTGTQEEPVWNQRTTFNVVNATQGKWRDDQVYWAIIGKDWATDQFVHVNASGQLVPMSPGDNGALTKNGQGYSNYFFRLDQTRSITIPPINSARLLMSVGSPMYIWVNTDVNGKIGYAGANIQNPTDPNIDVTFDFGEFALLPSTGGLQGLFINTTRVDQFGFPLKLEVTGLNGFRQTVGEPLTEGRDELFAKFLAETPAAFQGLAQAPYAPYRLVAPAHGTFQKDGDQQTYLDAYIAQVWAQWTNQDLVIDLQNGWKPFTGRVVGDRLRFTDADGGVYYINGRPTTPMALLGNGLLDDPTGGTTDVKKQLQLQAQVCAALNRRVAHLAFSQWWNPSAYYPGQLPANWFAKFWHDHSINALAYGFAYDDVGGHSPSIHTDGPVSVTYTIGW